MRVKLPASRPARLGIAVGAAAVLAAVAIAGGLLFTPADEGPQPGPQDVYAEPPGCGLVASGLPDDTVTGALDHDALRPLPEGTARHCAWTTVDGSDTVSRWLHVDLEVHFGAEEPDGAEIAARHLEDMRGDHARERDDLGSTALLRPAGEGAAEVAFQRDNLLVRVRYGGAADTHGEPLEAEDAEEEAVALAAAVEESV